MQGSTENKALLEVIEIMGSQAALARGCGVRPPTITKWINSGKVPDGRALEVEALVDGKVTRHRLSPKMYPLESAA